MQRSGDWKTLVAPELEAYQCHLGSFEFKRRGVALTATGCKPAPMSLFGEKTHRSAIEAI